MSTTPASSALFQQTALATIEELERLLRSSEHARPDTKALLEGARALRSGIAPSGLDGLADLASTIERVAAGVDSQELRWDQRLHFAVQGALVELGALAARAGDWGESEQRRSRTQSVALASIAAGYFALQPQPPSAAAGPPVVPISRFFPDDGQPGVVTRNPNPPFTLAGRFRNDIAAAASGVEREAATFTEAAAGGAGEPGFADGVRRQLLALSGVAESYGATSIAALALTMARAPLNRPAERDAVGSLARLLQDRARTDQELASQVKEATLRWPGRRTPTASHLPSYTPALVPRIAPAAAPAAPPPVAAAPMPAAEVSGAIVPIEGLLYTGSAALARARTVHDELVAALSGRGASDADAAVAALLEELSDLLDLAATP